MYQDVSTCDDWSVKRGVVYLPIRLKRISTRTSGGLRAASKTSRGYITLAGNPGGGVLDQYLGIDEPLRV